MLTKNRRKLYGFTFLLIVNIFSFVLVQSTFAQGSITDDPQLKTCMDTGDCQLNHFVMVAVQVSKIILGLSGSAALLAFVIGGVMMLVSAGNKNMIDRGKAAIVGAVIGLVIVFTSWIIIGFIYTKLELPNASSWFTIR